jgi:hypothetical protein
MRSSWTQIGLRLAGALVVVLSSFFITLQVLDYWSPVQPASMQPPAYNDAALPRLSPGQKLDFSNGQNRSALLSGWSGPEPSAVWSDGHNAFIGFVVGNGATPREAVIHADVFLAPPMLAQQTLQVWSAGVKLADYRLNTQHADIRIPLRGIDTKAGAPVILGLYLTNAIAPHAISDSGDMRILGLFLQSLELIS